MMNHPIFPSPQLPPPVNILSYPMFLEQAKGLITGLQLKIEGEAEHHSINSTEWLCDGALVYLSMLENPVSHKEIRTLTKAAGTIGVQFRIDVSFSGFTEKAAKEAEKNGVALFQIDLYGQTRSFSTMAKVLSVMGAPATAYTLSQPREVFRGMYAEMSERE